MKKTFRQRFWKISKWFIGIFLLMLIFRLLYGYTTTRSAYGDDYSDSFFNNVRGIRKNYASEKMQQLQQPGSNASSQKYEKTATVKSKTSNFEKDIDNIKNVTTGFAGVIQYEQNKGNKGSRELQLLIGINPEKFDSFYQKIQGIGEIKSTEITKIDKTNEYRQLNAKKASLEKNLASLNELKSRGGDIDAYIKLNEKILDIESQMQELGVELGNFDEINEFCTVKFSLYEGAPVKAISFTSRFKIALEWTIKYYAVLIFSLLMLSIGIFILLLIIDKLKVIGLITKKLDE